jgi:putative ABC transport system permease protein
MPTLLALYRAWTRPFRTLGFFSVLWLATLALGISVTAICVMQIQQTVLRPIGFSKAQELVAIERFEGMCRSCPISAGLWRDLAATPELQVGAYTNQPKRLSGKDILALSVSFSPVTPNFFDVFGTPALLGRLLSDADSDSDAVVISETFWRSQFAARVDIIGQQVRLGEQNKVIVGVLNPAFSRLTHSEVFGSSRFSDSSDGNNFLRAIARVPAHVSPAKLSAGLQNALSASRKRAPNNYSGLDLRLQTSDLQSNSTRWQRDTLYPVLAIVLLLALLMAANASSLFAVSVLARIEALSTEIALGASRTRLLLGIVAQSLLFTVTAALFAALLSPALFALTREYLLVGMSSLLAVQFQFSSLIIVSAGFACLNIIAAVLPAALILRNVALNSSERSTLGGAGARFGRHALALQLVAATSVVMLALLLLRTMDNVNQVDPGFDVKQVWTAKLILPNEAKDVNDAAAQKNGEFIARLRQALARVPGVEAVAVAGDVPLGQQAGNNGDFIIPGASSKDANQAPYAQFRPISEGYAQALGLRLVRGKLPQWQPGEKLMEAAVNQEYVDRYMPGLDPIGRTVPDRNVRIVGVLQSVRQAGLSQKPEPDYYASFANFYWYTRAQLIIRAAPKLQPQLFEQVRKITQAIDPSVPLFEPESGADLHAFAMQETTLLTRAVLSFALLALLTTALGLFGICAFAVARRRREFGLRMAIGAAPLSLVREVLRDNLKLSGICALLGLFAGYALSQIIATQLYGVSRLDWASAAGAVLVMLVMSALAALLPAHRASRTDPLVVLRAP